MNILYTMNILDLIGLVIAGIVIVGLCVAYVALYAYDKYKGRKK